MGIGCKTAGKILGLSASSITRGWRNHGIIATRPTSGSIVHEGRKIINRIKLAETAPAREEQMKWKRYESAWMRDIKSHKAFPDWGYEWTKEKSRREMRRRYSSFTEAERKEWNRLASSRNPSRRKKVLKEWKRNKMATDPIYRMINSFRARLCALVKSKESKTKDLIGCSPAQLRMHLESGFKKGMTWDNYGTHWHVDHVLPCASFDHSDPRQVAQCWHWTNLAPLEATKNLEKSDSITKPQMQLMLCATH